MTSSMVAPALVWPDFTPDSGAAGTRAGKRLRGARRGAASAGAALALAADALGIDAPPAAPLARLGEGLAPGDGRWLRAEPVMLVPDRDRLVLMRLDEDPLSDEEARDLLAATQQHFEASELQLERTATGHWYAAAPAVPAAAGLAPEQAAGAGVNDALARGESDTRRERLLNEIQMLWHAHPVNSERRAAGRIQANALWFWGGGVLPPAPEPAARGVIAASGAEWRGLAHWLGLEHAALAGPEALAPEAVALVVVGPGEEALGSAWLEALARRRQGFRLFAASGRWRVPRRLLPRW